VIAYVYVPAGAAVSVHDSVPPGSGDAGEPHALLVADVPTFVRVT
jgi:hypothetical protein